MYTRLERYVLNVHFYTLAEWYVIYEKLGLIKFSIFEKDKDNFNIDISNTTLYYENQNDRAWYQR